MIQQQYPPSRGPPLSGNVNAVLSDVYTSFTENIPLPTSVMPDEITKATLCQANCSGNGECRDGSCYCMIKYDGDDCRHINFSYHVAFASIFFLLALTSLIQLAMCIHAEYLRMKKTPINISCLSHHHTEISIFCCLSSCFITRNIFCGPNCRIRMVDKFDECVLPSCINKCIPGGLLLG